MGGEGDHRLSSVPPPPNPILSDGEISRRALAREEERKRIEALRPPMSATMAQAELQRKGRTVYRATVVGGPTGCWVVSGLGKEVTDAQLIAEAERVLERARA